MIGKVKEMLSSWPASWPVSEKHIAELVVAAANNGILDIQKEYKVNGKTVIPAGEVAKMAQDRCFLCAFRKDSTRTYAICFGRNPVDVVHRPNGDPFLERASRASDFVSALLNVINREYNCFIVPTNIGYPSCDVVKERLRLPSACKVTYVRESDLMPTADDRRTYELEFVIMASVGEHFRRMNDCVLVKSLGNGTFDYEYRRENRTILTESQAGEWAKVDAARKSSRKGGADNRKGKDEDQNDLQIILEAVQRPEEKKRILDVFAASPDSEFYQFMQTLEQQNNLKVGKINLTPCYIFVSAIPQKTYVYSVTDPKDSSKKAEISLVWNKPAGDFTKDTPLYIDSENGKLKGLTYMKDYADPSNSSKRLSRFPLDDSDTLAIVRTKDNGRLITLVRPAGQGSRYKNLDCAVNVDKISSMISSKFEPGLYPENDVEFMTIIGGNPSMPEPILVEDLAICPMTETKYWNGNRTSTAVNYVDAEGLSTVSGWVYEGSCTTENTHYCPYCSHKIFASPKRWEKYQMNHRLVDGSAACEFCMKPGNVLMKGGKRYKFYPDAYDPVSKKGQPLFVEWENKESRPIKNGNAYECQDCKRIIYKSKNSPVATFMDCTVCESRFCPECFQNAEPKKLVNGQPLCKCCFQSPPGLVQKGKMVYKAWNRSETREEYVLDGINTVDSIFHCAECGRPVYHSGSGSYNRCECCGKLIGDQCWKGLSKDGTLGMRLCKTCRAETASSKFQNLVKERNLAQEKRRNAWNEMKNKEAEITRNWKGTFLTNPRPYLKYMSSADRQWFKRHKNRAGTWDIVVHECFYSNEGAAEVIIVRFSLVLKKRRPVTYSFMNDRGNVVVGG